MARIVTSISLTPEAHRYLETVQDFNLSKFVDRQIKAAFIAKSNQAAAIEARQAELKARIEELEDEYAQQERDLARIRSTQDHEKHEFLKNLGNLLIQEGLAWPEIHQRYNLKFGDVSEEEFNEIKAEYGF